MNDLAERTLKLAEQLLGRASLTPDDAGCMELVADRLQGLGFRIEWITRNGVTNLWARRGTARPLICLAGHTDVVPTGPFSQWTSPPFEPTVREGFLFARGAADMKSSLAAFVTACEDFLGRFPEHPGSIAFLLTSDEEGDAIDGTRVVIDVLRARGETVDYCILGEPTAVRALGDTIKNGRRGSLHGRLRVKGLQGHIAYPHLAKNPIHLVAPAIAELAGMRWDEGNEFFPPTTWQISNIHAGTGADNVIPGTLEARFNFRFSTASTVHSLQQRLEAVLHAHGLEFTLEWTLGAAPFLTGEGELIDAAIEAIGDETGAQPELSTSGGTSDGRFIATICPQIVEIGPVNATSHKIDECVEVASLAKLSGIYRRIVERLLIGSVS